jgi:glycosyltransferase involved in cell wall biosynthesis
LSGSKDVKVLHLDSETVFGGGQSQLFILIRKQLDQGIECHLAANPGSEVVLRAAGTCPAVPISMRNDADLAAALKIADYCLKNRIDVIHAHNGRSHALGLMSLYFNTGPRLVVHRRVDFPLRMNLLNYIKYSNKKISAYIAVSGAVKAKLLGFARSEIILVITDSMPEIKPMSDGARLGFKEELCRELGADPALPVILAAGRLSPEKGHAVLLKALSIMHEQNVKFTAILAGEGPLRSTLEKEIEGKCLKGSVFVAGFRNDVENLLQISDLYVMPSLSEGLGSGILEAFAAGCPVAASRTGGITELVEDEISGLLFQPGQAGQMAEKIRRLLTDRTGASRLGRNARERARERHDPGKLAAEVAEIYKRTLIR